jgi:hypothetical protein
MTQLRVRTAPKGQKQDLELIDALRAALRRATHRGDREAVELYTDLLQREER